MPSCWCGRIIGPLRSWPIAAETNPRPRLSQCRAYSVLASISLCASRIAASGIGGEVRARSRILANAGTAISSLSALPSCPLRSLMSDVLGAIAEAITRLPANHAREKESGTVVMARRSEGRVGNPRLRETCGLLPPGHTGRPGFEAVKALASLSSRRIFEFMAGIGGQLVSVSIPSVEGGTPTYSAVVVAEPDPKKAEQLVRETAAHNEEVEAIGPVPESVVKLFELKAGQFTPWRNQEPN